MVAKKTIERLETELTVNGAKMRRGLEKNLKETKSWQLKTSKIQAAAVAGFAVAGIAVLQKKVLSATIEQERAVKQLEQGLKTTAGQVGFSLQELTAQAAKLQTVTNFGDEKIISAQSKLVTFTKITGDEFRRTTEAAADLAVRMEMDLTSATVQLAKALNDPVANLGALSRAGIQFTKEQKDTVKALWESGRAAEAQRIILSELETQFGGSARAARDTFGGALKSLGNAAGDLLEADNLGGAADKIEELTTLLQSQETKAAATSLANAMIAAFAGATKAITGTVNVVRFLAEELAASIAGPAIGDMVRLTEELAEKETKLATIRANLARGVSGHAKRNWLKREQELTEEVAYLKKAIAISEEGFVTPKIARQAKVVSAGPAPGVGSVVINKDFEKLNANLQQQIELFGLSGQAAKLRYKLEHGLIDNLSNAQMEALVAQAELLDKKADQKVLLEGIDGLENELKTEEEKLAETYANRQQMLEGALESKLITEQRYADLTGRLQGRADDERRKSLVKGVESMLDIAGAYYDGMNTKEAARARLALQIGKTLLDDEKRNSIKKIAIHTYETAIKAYKAMAAIPYIGPALGAAAAGSVLVTGGAYAAKVAGIAHGGLTDVPQESTYLLQKGERVLSPNQNRDFTRFIASKKQDAGGVVVHIHEAPGVKNSVESFEQNGQKVVVVRQLVRGLVQEELALQQEPGGLLNSYAV